VSFVFIPMGLSPRQKIAPNVSRIKATIPMINNDLKPLQSRRKILIENISNISDDIAEIDKELAIHRRVSRLNYSRLNKCIYPIRKRESKSIRNAKVLLGCRSIPPFLGFNGQAV